MSFACRVVAISGALAASAALATPSTTMAAGTGGEEVIMAGLALPIGLESDAHGQLWVSELGLNMMDPTVPPNGRVSMLARNLDDSVTMMTLVEGGQVAFNQFMEPSGWHHIAFDSQGRMLLATGGPQNDGAYPYLGSVVVLDPSLPVLADGPHAVDGDALVESIPVFPYIRQDAGYPDSNVYSAAEIGGELWIVDAGANAVVAYDDLDGFRVVAEFPNQTNPKGTTPPTSQAVPTRIVPDGDGGAFVVQLTGFPFVDAMANIFRISSDGEVTTFASGLKTLVDIEVAADGSLLVCSVGDFDPTQGIYAPGTGRVIRVRADGSFDTFIGGLFMPTAVEVVGDDVYVAQFVPGTVSRYPGLAPQPCPGDINGDGIVDSADIGLVIASWGFCP